MSEREQPESDSDQTVILSLNGVDRTHPGSWAEEAQRLESERIGTDDPGAAMTGLGFIWSAVRRSGRLILILAFVGLLAGFGVLKVKPPLQQASTTLYMADTPGTSAGQAILNDQSLVESRTVAGTVIRKLGLHLTVQAFLSHYTATVGVSQVLTITAKAPVAADAIREANGLAAELLAFQQQTLSEEERLVARTLQVQVGQAQQQVSSLTQQIDVLKGQGQSATDQAKLNTLRNERDVAQTDYSLLKVAASGQKAGLLTADAVADKDSQVIDPAAIVPQSAKKRIVLYAGGGLVAGLIVAVAIVAVAALVSDRLRRRDDVARILGAPVRLSVRKVRPGRWRPAPDEGGVIADVSVRRIVRHLRRLVHVTPDGPDSLAVIAVDDLKAPAACAAALAVSCAKEGARVVVADLSPGGTLARLLGSKDEGVHKITVSGAKLVAVVASGKDLPPDGPLRRGRRRAKDPDVIDDACRSADLLVSFMTIDPAIGADHLPEWAAGAVVFVTAGRSTAARVYATGQLISLAGVTDVSAVLLGADKTDESLGVKKSQQDEPEAKPAAVAERVRTGSLVPPDPEIDYRAGAIAGADSD